MTPAPEISVDPYGRAILVANPSTLRAIARALEALAEHALPWPPLYEDPPDGEMETPTDVQRGEPAPEPAVPPKIDAADAHAFAMFSAGWRAAFAECAGNDAGAAAVASPTDFYLAVRDPAARACSVQKVIDQFVVELQAVQGSIRDVDRYAQNIARNAEILAARLGGAADLP